MLSSVTVMRTASPEAADCRAVSVRSKRSRYSSSWAAAGGEERNCHPTTAPRLMPMTDKILSTQSILETPELEGSVAEATSCYQNECACGPTQDPEGRRTILITIG